MCISIINTICDVCYIVNRSAAQQPVTPMEASVSRPRTARVVARKGGPSGTDIHTPTKDSPSTSAVTMAGGLSTGNISSLTVAQVCDTER